MDPLTARYYIENAAHLAEAYEAAPSSIARYFGAAFPAGSRVLDIGAGSGRDLAALRAQGYDAYGIEPAEALRREALARHPELTGRLEAGSLPALDAPFDGRFEGALCSAVLMHVPEGELFDSAFALRQVLAPHGRLLISLPIARDDVREDGRDAGGRLFNLYPTHYLQLLFERIGFQQIGRWEDQDALGRNSVRWSTLLFELRSAGPLRPVDQIEGILNRDKKEATYKLALFRALAELATQEPRIANWRADGNVGVPVARLAEKWLLYYWPLFASEDFIPQSRAEGAGSNRQLQFRRPTTELLRRYQGEGQHSGLSAWKQHVESGTLDAQGLTAMTAALRSIEAAIIDGPVRYAGGALESGTVFAFDRQSRQVLLSADIWREFTLLGHWILDAVILRWAELTADFSQRQAIDSGRVLPLLLARPETERATRLAREIYRRRGSTLCTWTGLPLTSDFVVDHAIPFSLWANNDLWNLLPADKQVNSRKSDRLPTAELVAASGPRIMDNWRLLREAAPEPFARQAMHLLGAPIPSGAGWEQRLFSCLREMIEVTAIQRGVERWAPRQ